MKNNYAIFKFSLILFFLLVVLSSCTRPESHQQYLSSEALKLDLDMLIKNIEDVHPNPYTKISKASIMLTVDSMKNNLKDSTSLLDFFAMVSPLISSLQDGHTGVKYPYKDFKKMAPNCLAFYPKVSSEKKIFTQKAIQGLPLSAEILSIDSIASERIVNRLLSSINGESEAYRLMHLNKSFVERYGAFYGFKKKHLIKYKFNDKIETLEVDAKSLRDLKGPSKQKNKKQQNVQPFSYEKIQNNVGYIDFRKFRNFNEFEIFLDSTFASIQKDSITNLIIDIRQNGGGDSKLGDALFQYISDQPFAQFAKSTIKFSKQREDFYKRYRANGALEYLSDSEFDSILKPGVRGIKVYDEEELIPLNANAKRFTGNVYLLTSLRSFSSASDFAWCFKYFEMGTIVGETTGGYIVCFGDLVMLDLPHSQLELFISHKEFYGYGATDKERHGVIPHHEVPANEAIDYTLKLIESH